MAARIAIVEDDQSIAQMYKLKFEAEGDKVEVAGNGVLGLKLAQEMKPDIILLDIMMPEMSGDEMLDKMRKTLWGKNIKVIVLTNVGDEEIPKSMTKNGVISIVQKAFHTPSQVVELVKDALKS
jgi:DNA-binding response OmpR family regulator